MYLMSRVNLILVANELSRLDLNGPNVVFGNIIKTILKNENEFSSKFRFYFIVPKNFNLNSNVSIGFDKNFNENKESFNEKVNFIKVKGNGKLDLFFVLLKLIRKIKGDYLIIYPKLMFLPFMNNQVAFLYDLPMENIYKDSNLNIDKFKEKIKREFILRRKIIDKLDLILTISNSSKNDIQEILGINNIDYIYLGVDNEVFKVLDYKEIKEILNKYGLDYKGYFFYPAGKLWFRKNIINLIIAFYKFISVYKNKDLKLVITANNYEDINNEYVLKVKKVVSDTGISERVRFLFVNSKDLVGLYNGAIACVFSSFYEGFGLPILESLACKVPILFSDILVFNEIFSENIFKFDPNSVDSISSQFVNFMDFYIKKDRGELDRIIELGYKKVSNFKWIDSVSLLLEKIIKKISFNKVASRNID